MSLKKRTWEILEVARPDDRVSRAVDVAILLLILVNVIAVIIGTVHSIAARVGRLLDAIEIVSVIIFSIEYIGRLWSVTCDPRFRHPILGRLRFAARPMPLIDLLAVAPFYLPLIGVDLRFVRVLRVMRIARLLKVGRYSRSMRLMGQVIAEKREELILTTIIMLMLLVVSSCVLYYCETEAQPDAFPSIPATMWWSIATLTTVGYGDVTPITPIGKFFASLIAVLGIGMFALPTGVLGAGYVESIERRKQGEKRCPHCGEVLADG